MIPRRRGTAATNLTAAAEGSTRCRECLPAHRRRRRPAEESLTASFARGGSASAGPRAALLHPLPLLPLPSTTSPAVTTILAVFGVALRCATAASALHAAERMVRQQTTTTAAATTKVRVGPPTATLLASRGAWVPSALAGGSPLLAQPPQPQPRTMLPLLAAAAPTPPGGRASVSGDSSTSRTRLRRPLTRRKPTASRCMSAS